ncbi:hypothetical protein O181_008487 [Austropuccinia psidii MF-1]|uniref:Uncharacterized protein n=1 Tax=Austropuccinia psidii MF-1 TaxID=1389203 RepID=A0A9Q3BNW3_9BASI|nr:hypothetical protein [Austropuccinia psidii MF-1]
MDKKRFNLACHWEEIGASCQKICPKEIYFKDFVVITKGCTPTRQFRLLEVRENRIKKNKATIKGIEEQLTQTGKASHHSGSRRSVAKSNQSLKSYVVSRRTQGYKGKNKTSFNQRQKQSDPMIQRLLDLVKEVHKSLK